MTTAEFKTSLAATYGARADASYASARREWPRAKPIKLPGYVGAIQSDGANVAVWAELRAAHPAPVYR